MGERHFKSKPCKCLHVRFVDDSLEEVNSEESQVSISKNKEITETAHFISQHSADTVHVGADRAIVKAISYSEINMTNPLEHTGHCRVVRSKHNGRNGNVCPCKCSQSEWGSTCHGKDTHGWDTVRDEILRYQPVPFVYMGDGRCWKGKFTIRFNSETAPMTKPVTHTVNTRKPEKSWRWIWVLWDSHLLIWRTWMFTSEVIWVMQEFT